MLSFCTLFDSNYLSRGLTMYDSLRKSCKEFHLYIFPFDDRTFRALDHLKLPHSTLVHQGQFEDRALLAVKPTRTPAEYYWTATSSIILYVLNHFDVHDCTYVDADLFFYASPTVLIDEMAEDSVLITEHRYSPEYDLTAVSGIYCVQFITFKNDQRGLSVLKWWRERCLEWCYDRLEDGKFGDQKYLDDWPARFEGVHVLRHLGGGVAPWNVQQYRIENTAKGLVGTDVRSGETFPVIFYHFHFVRFYRKGNVDLGDYRLPQDIREKLYVPYLRHLEATKIAIGRIDDAFDPHGTRRMITDWRTPLIYLKRRYRGRYNVFHITELLDS